VRLRLKFSSSRLDRVLYISAKAPKGITESLIALVAVLVAACEVIPTAEQKTSEAVLNEVKIQPSFQFRGRRTFGSGQSDYHDIYLGPAKEVKPSIASVPSSFRVEELVTYPITEGEYQYLQGWSLRTNGLTCDIGLKKVVEDSAQLVYAELAIQEFNKVKEGDLAVIEVSSQCE
jgi:hypothetical protein